MNNKFYVSLEAARLLKEKGYKRDVNHFYNENGFLHDLVYEENYNYFQMSNNDLDLDHYAAPTKAEAIDWLESKGIVVETQYYNVWYLQGSWGCLIHIYGKDGKEETTRIKSRTDNKLFQTRLEAEEAAIIKALELL